MGVLFYMTAEVRSGGRWRSLKETLWCPQSDREAIAVFTGYGDPLPLMKPVAAFLPLRGIPSDASEYNRRLALPSDPLHYASWLLLRELVDFDWHGRQVTHLFDRDKSPPKAYTTPHNPDGTWNESYAEFVGTEVMEFLLPQLASFGKLEDVRVIYGLSR